MTLTFKPVGTSGTAIAPLVFGGNVFGWTADQATSFAILDRLLDAGLTSIDTAAVYSRWHPGNHGGESEPILGAWFASRGAGARRRVQLITKVGMDQGLAAAHIERAAEASLKRLQTDHIDIYFSHRWDGTTPQEETLAAYDRLIRAGKVRAIGASNFTAGQVRAALDVARRDNLPRYQILEPDYSLMERTLFEGPLADLAIAEGLAVIPYYALASGFLTGKYRREADLAGQARGERVRHHLNPHGLGVLAALDAVAARQHATLAAVAIAWLMRRPGVTAPIASASRVAQIDALIEATQLALTDEDMAQLTAASKPAG
jgi:aryl-alcohol dehydrogenase-like predicted oxidoreductase